MLQAIEVMIWFSFKSTFLSFKFIYNSKIQENLK